MKKIILIDGNSLVNRAYYATPPLVDKNGIPTNAVFAFVNMLGKLLATYRPEYLAVAFDVRHPTFRHEMYSGYKATRHPMPDDLAKQIPLLKDLLSTMQVRTYEKAGYEADDIIGTIAKKFDLQTYIITGDRDSFQLVDDNTTVLFTKRGITDLDEMNAENFKAKTGISPAQVVELKSLMGDASDNIPGVRGIGEKTAIALLEKYGTMENVYASASSPAESKGTLERLREGRENAILSHRLAEIDTHVPIDVTLEEMRCVFPFPAETRRAMVELDFRTLMNRTEWYQGGDAPLPSVAETAPAETKKVGAEEFAAVAAKGKFAFAFAERSLRLYADGCEYVLPLRETLLDEGATEEEAAEALRGAAEDPNAEITVFASKDFAHWLDRHGVALRARCEDVSIMKYVADYRGREETCEETIRDYRFPESTPAYSMELARARLGEAIEKEGYRSLYRDMELPLAKVLFDMENAGFKVDTEAMRLMGKNYKSRIDEIAERIYELAGERFNLNSTKQLGEILFVKLGLRSKKKTKRGLSTSAEVLEELADESEIVPLLLKFRQLQKLQSTYIDGFLPLIDRETGLIHTCFNQVVTATGRLSSKEPNLQNIPVRDDEGKEIRKLFIPRDDDHILVDADYSQIELRLLAHFSESESLIEAFRRGEDVHALTASQVFGVPLAGVTEEMRRSAKAVNFGIIYGISEFGLGKQLKIPPARAGAYIAKYFESYPGVKAYMERNVEFAKKNGYVATLFGRKRAIPELSSSNYNLRMFGERAAMNMPLQGTSADIIKIAMIRVAERMKAERLRAQLILQVHDELVVDAPISEKDRVAAILKEEMERAAELRVPLLTEVATGRNWYEAH